ncbi:MAG: hypothetical protein IJC69_05760 [Clostridia bacterium]|nr:hypothetical protein [Clostridia bacterium]
MKKTAQMAMLDIADITLLERDIEKMFDIAAVLTELEGECERECKSATLREDEPVISNVKITDGYITVPKVVGE